jgi:hypothetical protein
VAAIPPGIAVHAAAALVDVSGGVPAGVGRAIRQLENQLDVSLYDADPDRYLGLVLFDGMHGLEDSVNEAIGNLAPLMHVVGGSAGDDLEMVDTEIYLGDRCSNEGAVLAVLETAVPFSIIKTCSFVPAGVVFEVTEVDGDGRNLWELGGRPAAEVYAEAVGCRVADLDSTVFMRHPFGLMIEGQPWIRSPQQTITRDGISGLRMFSGMTANSYLDLMRATPLVEETAEAIQDAAGKVGRPSGSLLFNCAFRRLNLDAENLHGEFSKIISGMPTAGFHTYGETWGRHVNQTLTGVVFGEPV